MASRLAIPNDIDYTISPSPPSLGDDDTGIRYKPAGSASKARRPAGPVPHDGLVSPRSSRSGRVRSAEDGQISREAYEAALEEQELLASAHIWTLPLDVYAEEVRSRERNVDDAYRMQVAERSLDRALGITEWAGRSLDHLASLESRQSQKATRSRGPVAPSADEHGEVMNHASTSTNVDPEIHKKKSEAAVEGWRKRRAAQEAQAEQRAIQRERRAEAKRKAAAEVSASKLKKGYAFEIVGPGGELIHHNDDLRTPEAGPSTTASSPATEGPRRKRPRTERASAAAANAHLAIAAVDLDPNDPDYEFHLDQLRERFAAEAAATAAAEEETSPDASPLPSGPELDDNDEEFHELSNKKKKGKMGADPLLKAPKPVDIAGDDIERKIWQQLAKWQIPLARKLLDQSLGSRVNFHRRLIGLVQREAQRFQKKTKTPKEVQIKAKRVMRDMLMFWKGSDKRDRERKTKAEREAIDKVKREEDMREAKRAARKLNFLITQTELYSHFVGSKIDLSAHDDTAEKAAPPELNAPTPLRSNISVSAATGGDTSSQLTDLNFDDEDEANIQAHAQHNAAQAVERARQKAAAFDAAAAKALAEAGGAAPQSEQSSIKLDQAAFDTDELNFQDPTGLEGQAVPQPAMLTCQLKEYQLKGLSWLASLYDQGINGILADEMGLGKTVQSIALMAHLAEQHNIWGPFLVIAPASTLHNWQQEITRFVPTLKSLPYWGNPKDRTVLRKFWNRQKIRYDKDAPFHVLVTSYQLVVADEKYFQRVKWQYMVLDEAQAIKSSSSTRWRTLLNFHCRNRLLLTGTPIQNSMQELWALLHFIMPSLFDSHDEFSEWFAKDIEGGAEKGGMNEHQLRRLHMILKPFMLRRIKKNVQNELVDKVEIDVMCDLTARQKVMYQTLRTNISIADLVRRAQSLSTDDTAVKRLMNLIMQFRKVCNHPELFERADVTSPFAICEFAYSGPLNRESGEFLDLPYSTSSVLKLRMPKMMYQDLAVGPTTTDTHHLQRMLNIWRPDWIVDAQKRADSTFAFSRLQELSPSDINILSCGASFDRIRLRFEQTRRDHIAGYAEYQRTRPFAIWSKTALLPNDLVTIEEVFRRASRLKKPDAMMFLPKAVAPPADLVCDDRSYVTQHSQYRFDPHFATTIFGMPIGARDREEDVATLDAAIPNFPPNGFFGGLGTEELPRAPMLIPQLHKLVLDSGKLAKLDALLQELKIGDHRVLLYFQMTRMIDIMEEYLAFRGWKYLRLDGTSTIAERRDMVMDWQSKSDLFIFLLSTRAGGLGINLTAADTVIFYDSDWNPSNDAQAMDRAHRLGQTKQVTVYRLITQGTIDERILKLARNKKNVQDAVVGSSNATKPEDQQAKSQEVVSLLLDDAEMEESVRQAALKREQIYAKQVADGRRGAAQREANKRQAELEAREAAASDLAMSGLGNAPDSDDEDDGFDWFNSKKNGESGDAEDDIAVAKASEAPVIKKKRNRKAKGPDDSNVPKPKRQRVSKKQKESVAAAAVSAQEHVNGESMAAAVAQHSLVGRSPR